jgi:hypothetical protein
MLSKEAWVKRRDEISDGPSARFIASSSVFDAATAVLF